MTEGASTRRGREASRLLRAFVVFAIGAALSGGAAQAIASVRVVEAEFSLAPGVGTFGPVGALREHTAAGERVALPHTLTRNLVPQGESPAIDVAWYRLDVPSTMAGPLRLYLPRWQTVGQVAVYADDLLVYRSQAGPVWNGFNHPLWLALDDGRGAPPRAVWVRLDHSRGAGLGVSTAWIGTAAALGPSRWWREWLQADLPFLASSGFLVIGIFTSGVWLRRREATYALFSAASLLFFVRTLHYHLGLEPLPIPEPWFGWMTINALAWLIPVTCFLTLRLHGRRHRRTEWILMAPIVGMTVASLPPLAVLPSMDAAYPLLYLLMLFALVAMTVLGMWSAWRSRSRDALRVSCVNALSIPVGAHDLLLANFRVGLEQPYLLPYASMVLMGLFLQILLRRYLDALSESEGAKAVLERSLREREAELSASHARLREIERVQVLAQERERLMQDMHDGLGSSLIGALKVAEQGQEQNVAQVLRDCIEDLKLAIDSLEPAQADLLLLLATVRFRVGTRLEQAGIRLHWDVVDLPSLPWLDPRTALHILRILQEVLGNVARHSGARAVTVRTRAEASHVVVEIEDDGCGFDAEACGGRGRGLGHVRRRASAIGGRALWLRRPAGTCFELALPLRQAGAPPADAGQASALPQPASPA